MTDSIDPAKARLGDAGRTGKMRNYGRNKSRRRRLWIFKRRPQRQAVVMTIGDQTSVFLTAVAQGFELARYPAGIVVLGRFDKGLALLPTDGDERLQAVLARLHD